jgi:hypothetical protein
MRQKLRFYGTTREVLFSTNSTLNAFYFLQLRHFFLYNSRILYSTIEQGAKHLLQLRERVDKSPPEFLLVITATGFAHRRLDGVYVVPIGCLRD